MGWRDLRDLIAADIASGELAPGDGLPTQAKLALDHGLSRHEVRRALRALQERGLITTIQGSGCLVAQSSIRLSLTERPSLRRDAANQGHEVTTKTRTIWRGRPRRNIAAILGDELACEVVVCERLAYLNGRVFQSVRHEFHPGRVAIEENGLLGDTSLAEILGTGGIRQYSRTRFQLTVRQATATERADLEIAPSQPVIDVCILWGDGESRPIAATHAVTCADRLVVEF